jgi:hypothetical protein
MGRVLQHPPWIVKSPLRASTVGGSEARVVESRTDMPHEGSLAV